jgi:16S rRNA (guanine527-N7)-methyltransferase
VLNYLTEKLSERKVPTPEARAETMIEYMDRILEANQEINLTAITDRDEFLQKHFLDSLICYRWQEIEDAFTIADVGAGAGFPGVPLAIVYPHKEFYLIDSLKKRGDCVRQAVAELGITNVHVLHGRAETIGSDAEYRERFDLAISRAVAKLPVLLEYCIPLVKVGGFFYAYKTDRAIGEINDSEIALRILGAASDVEVREDDKTSTEFRHNIMIAKKVASTPAKYPRKEGRPAKIPL